MGRQASERAVALAIFGILVSLVLAILTAVNASSTAVVVCASVTLFLMVTLYVPAMRSFYRDSREGLQRRRLRARHGLVLVRGSATDLPPAQLPDGVYGYEEIFAVAGLRSTGSSANAGRIKPDRTNPESYPYPLEVHKHDNDVWLVGYVDAGHQRLARDAAAEGELILWMRRTKTDNVLVEIPLSRVVSEQSRGDRSWDSSAQNLFRLVLTLQPDQRP